MDSTTLSALKQKLGHAAAALVQEGMIVGLGSGTTASCFIGSLGARCRQGLKITAVASSTASAHLAAQAGIPLVDFNDCPLLDLAIDGADEVDGQKRLIKGGGGALLREKMVASSTRAFVVLVDSTKLVDRLGVFPLPLEVVPFGYQTILRQLAQLGYHAQIRKTEEGKPFVTDNDLFLIDVHFSAPCEHPEEDHARLRSIVGVVETGFFFGLAHKILVAWPDGRLEWRE